MSAGTVIDALDRRTRDTPRARAFVVEGESITFERLSADAHSLARRLAHERVSSGDRCAMLLPTGLDFITLVCAAQIAGAIPVAIDPSLATWRQDRRLRMLTPRLVVATDSVAAALLHSSSPEAPRIVTVGDLRRGIGATGEAREPLPEDILAPREIEECVERLEDVVSSAAVGVARSDRCTEGLVVVVETSADLPARGPAIVERVTRTVIETIGMAPAQVVVVPPSSIPRASSGKILHVDLRRLLIDEAFLRKASFGG